MYAQNLSVTFGYGSSSKTIKCDYVTMGVRPIGDVLEKIDYSLEENYFGGRMSFEMAGRTDLAGAEFLAHFVLATDKSIAIDGTEYEVVNDQRQAEFPFYQGVQSVGVSFEFKLMRKTTGIEMGSYTVGAQLG